MPMHKLTQGKLSALTEPGLYGDGGNLHFRIAPGGSKQWMFRYSRASKQREHGIGPYPTIGLDEARDKAHVLRKLLLDGVDPIEHKRALVKPVQPSDSISFQEAVQCYYDTHSDSWKNIRNRYDWLASLENHVIPMLGAMQLSEIDTPHIVRVLEPIWVSRYVTAGRIRTRIEAILDWAKVKGYRSGENPARLRGHLDHLLPKVRKAKVHFRAMPYQDIPALMCTLSARSDLVGIKALQFTILTACRVEEVMGATWDEVSGSVWTIPAIRMKGNKEHSVPLSRGALAILKAQKAIRRNEYLFPAIRNSRLQRLALMHSLRAIEPAATVHGFRSSFRDWAGERTNMPREIAEMSLAHSVGNAVERAYARSTLLAKRQELMCLWSSFCLSGAKK